MSAGDSSLSRAFLEGPSQPRPTGRSIERLVETHPVQDTPVLLLEESWEFFPQTFQDELTKHFVGDLLRHEFPLAPHRLCVQPVAGVSPTVEFENSSVGSC